MKPTRYHAAPEEPGDRLRDVLNKYRNLKVLRPIISNLCEDDETKKLFKKCLTQDLSVIQARSQDLVNHEITVYQKAFVILMNNEDDHVGGIEIYFDELLGLSLIKSTDHQQALETAIKARELIYKGR